MNRRDEAVGQEARTRECFLDLRVLLPEQACKSDYGSSKVSAGISRFASCEYSSLKITSLRGGIG